MRFQFTKHSQDKIKLLITYGFSITRSQIKQTIQEPVKREPKSDGTFIASSLIDSSHILRVVYRQERDIIIVITLYPGKRKSYGL